MIFKEIATGQKFHTGKSRGIGARRENIYYTVYEKVSASKAIVKEQVGYDNQRCKGDIITFSWSERVWSI